MGTPEPDRAKIIGKRVGEFREKAGMTRPVLARKLAIHRSHLWRIEEGQTRPSPELEERMCRLFHCSLDDLRGMKQGRAA